MKLIGAVTSPYVRKVRIVMAEKKLEYQFVLEDIPESRALEEELRLYRRALDQLQAGVMDRPL